MSKKKKNEDQIEGKKVSKKKKKTNKQKKRTLDGVEERSAWCVNVGEKEKGNGKEKKTGETVS